MKGLIEKNDSKSTESSEEQKNLVQNYEQLKKEAAEQEDKIRNFKSQISVSGIIIIIIIIIIINCYFRV